MNKETITISFVGKFGPSVNGVWYNIDQKSGLKVEQFEKGKTYDVLVNTSKAGKKYITQIIAEGPYIVSPETVSSITTEKPGDDKILHAPVTVSSRGGSASFIPAKRDFDAEARGKISCALRSALYSSPGLSMYCTSYEEWLKKIDDEVKRGAAKVLEDQRGE